MRNDKPRDQSGKEDNEFVSGHVMHLEIDVAKVRKQYFWGFFIGLSSNNNLATMAGVRVSNGNGSVFLPGFIAGLLG